MADGTRCFQSPGSYFSVSPPSHATMGEIEEIRETRRSRDGSSSSPDTYGSEPSKTPAGPGIPVAGEVEENLTFWQRVKKPGSVWQIIFAALAAIALGLIVTTQVEEVPEAAIALVAIPGTLWLRALRAVGTLFLRIPQGH